MTLKVHLNGQVDSGENPDISSNQANPKPTPTNTETIPIASDKQYGLEINAGYNRVKLELKYAAQLNTQIQKDNSVAQTGLYKYADGTTDKEKKIFEAGLQKAKETLPLIEKQYSKDSDEYKNAVRALNAYNNNGVIVKFGNLNGNTLGETKPTIRKTGANTIEVIIDLKKNKSGNDLLTTIAHEGSHIQDNSDYQRALLVASNVSEEAANAVMNGHLRVTHGASETRAFGVSSVFAEFRLGGGKDDSAISSGGGTTSFKFDVPPVKSITVGGEPIWKSSWQSLSNDEKREKRAAAIAKGLKNDPDYAPKLDKPIDN